MKKLFILTTLIVFIFPLAIPCFAKNDVDMDFDGVVPYTYGDNTSEETTVTGTKITNDLTYDSNTALYYFYADGISEPFSSNICDGLVTKDPVVINVPKGITATLYNSNEVYTGDFTSISEAGKYNLQFKTNSGDIVNIMKFTIIGDTTCLINSFEVPDGFTITSAVKDDENIVSQRIDLSEEGLYSIRYIAVNSEKEYVLDFTVDNTAPTLALAEVKNGKAWGPVSLADLEPGATVTVIRDGEVEGYTNNELTQSGNYTLYVRDAAGNTTEYEFTIMIYFNLGSIFLFAAILVVAAALGIYIFFAKNKLKVR